MHSGPTAALFGTILLWQSLKCELLNINLLFIEQLHKSNIILLIAMFFFSNITQLLCSTHKYSTPAHVIHIIINLKLGIYIMHLLLCIKHS